MMARFEGASSAFGFSTRRETTASIEASGIARPGEFYPILGGDSPEIVRVQVPLGEGRDQVELAGVG